MWPVIARIPLPFPVFGSDHLPIRAFGLMLVLAILAAHALWAKNARREGYSRAVIDNFFLIMVASIVIGARLLYVIVEWRDYKDDLASIFAIHKGGMVFYGSFLGAVAGFIGYAKFYRLPILRFLDICAAPTGLGLIIGRIGCLLVGDDYGSVVDESFPIAIKFPTAHETGSFWGLSIEAGNGNLAGPMAGKWLHPTQLYMSLNGLVLLVVITWLSKRRRFAGQLTAAFCMLYAVNRSIIEEFRGDEDRGFVGSLSTSQFISIFVFLAGAALWIYGRKRPFEEAPAA